MIFVETLWPALVGILFLSLLGWAASDWLLAALPAGLRRAAAPWTGYALFVVLAQFTTQLGLDMTWTALAALAVALLGTAVWLLARRGRTLGPRPGRAGWLLIGLTAAVFVLGVLPLWLYGYSTIIGENWDGEIYLALGAYLRDFAQPALAQAPPNPLLTTLLVPPYSGRTHGFSYAHAAIGALSGLPSLATLSPVLALLRALAVPATYVFFRTAWAWRPRPALLASAVLGLNPFLLWITYNTFGMQVPSLGLLPLGVAATLLALRAPGPRPGAFAALIVAALAVTYHPALTAWAALAGLGGLVLLLTAGRTWPRVLIAGVGVAVGAVALSAVAQWLSLGGFLAQYADQTPGLGLTAFTAPTDALGLSLSFRTLLAAGPGQPLLAAIVRGYAVLVGLGGVVAALLALLWAVRLLRRRSRDGLVAVAALLGAVVYVALFWRPLDYVYGWFKAQSFVAFVLVGAVVGGAAVVGEAVRARRGTWLPRAGLAAALLPAAVLLLTLALLLRAYAQPLRYSADMIDSRAIAHYVQPGDSVWISSSRLMPGRLFYGLLSYFVRDAAVYGTFHTANSAWDTVRPGGVYTWAVLPAREPPQPAGYAPADQVWANSLLALYHAPAGLLFHQDWDRKGDYPAIPPAAPQVWHVAPDSVRLGGSTPPGGGTAPRTLEFGVASFVTRTLGITVTAGSGAPVHRPVTLQPGLQPVSLAVPSPATVALAADGPGEAAVRWVTLHEGQGASPPAAGAPLAGVLMLGLSSSQQGTTIETRLQWVDTRPAERQADRVVVDVYRQSGSGAEADHFGYWAFRLTGSPAVLRVDPGSGAATAGAGALPLPADSRRGAATSGTFTASLTFYRGTSALGYRHRRLHL